MFGTRTADLEVRVEHEGGASEPAIGRDPVVADGDLETGDLDGKALPAEAAGDVERALREVRHAEKLGDRPDIGTAVPQIGLEIRRADQRVEGSVEVERRGRSVDHEGIVGRVAARFRAQTTGDRAQRRIREIEEGRDLNRVGNRDVGLDVET